MKLLPMISAAAYQVGSAKEEVVLLFVTRKPGGK
jgi:hypothetical protein